MGNLIENRIISDLQKARTGRYEDNAENRRLHRVGQPYGTKGNGGNEQKGDNSDVEEITARVDRVLDVLSKRHNVSKEDLKVFVKEKIKNADYEDEKLPYDITDNLDKMVRHLSETGAGKKVAASIKKEKPAGKESSEESDEKDAQGDEKETFTRVKFEDVPNSGKVNLKKYLSEKMKKSADAAWGDVSKIDTEGLKKMEKGLVEEFNRQFDDLPKSRRAEKLYAIMKVKGELTKRGSDSKRVKKSPGEFAAKEESIYAKKLRLQDEISGMEIQHRIKEQNNSWDHDNDERVLFRRKMNEKNKELAEVKNQIAKETKK